MSKITYNIIKEIHKKAIDKNAYESAPYYIATDAKFVGGVRGTHGSNIEEQFLIGFDCITTKKIESNGDEVITQEFRTEDVINNYYKIITYNYKQPNYSLTSHYFDANTLNLENNPNDNNLQNTTLNVMSPTYSANGTELNINNTKASDLPMISRSLLYYICNDNSEFLVSEKILYISETDTTTNTIVQKQVIKNYVKGGVN